MDVHARVNADNDVPCGDCVHYCAYFLSVTLTTTLPPVGVACPLFSVRSDLTPWIWPLLMLGKAG